MILDEDDPDAVNHMLRYMYHFHYEPGRMSENSIIEHMRVQKIANKYNVPGLANQAWYRYGITMVVAPLFAFIPAVREAYGSDGYDEFREDFVDHIISALEERRQDPDKSKAFWDMIESLPDLAMDLLRSDDLVNRSSRCGSCEKRKQAALALAGDDSD